MPFGRDISAIAAALRVQNAGAQNAYPTWTSTTIPNTPVVPIEIYEAAIAVAEAEFALIGVKDSRKRDRLETVLQEAMAKYMAAKLARE